MCTCTPSMRTPFCGKPGCTWPVSGKSRPSAMDVLVEEPRPGVWYGVYNPKAVRNQPLALFRFLSDAVRVGNHLSLSEVEVREVCIEESKPPGEPMVPITLIL